MATGVVPEDLLEVGTACREDDLVPLEDCAVKLYVINQRVMVTAYLIFVISFTQAGFLNPKFLHPKTTQNTQKLQQIPPKSVKYAVLRVQSGKFYTGQNFFTRAPPVVPVTNMRYDQ